MTYRVFFVPALALGLACSTTHSSRGSASAPGSDTTRAGETASAQGSNDGATTNPGSTSASAQGSNDSATMSPDSTSASAQGSNDGATTNPGSTSSQSGPSGSASPSSNSGTSDNTTGGMSGSAAAGDMGASASADSSGMHGSADTGSSTGYGSTGSSATGPAGTGMHSDMKGHASDKIVTGRVAKASKKSLEIQSSDGTTSKLSIVDQTTVMIDGQDARASDLKPGQDVRASFNEQDGKNVAVKVEVGRSMGGTGSGPDAAGSASYPPGSKPDSGSRNDAGQGGTSGTAAPGRSNPAQPQSPDSSTSGKW